MRTAPGLLAACLVLLTVWLSQVALTSRRRAVVARRLPVAPPGPAASLGARPPTRWLIRSLPAPAGLPAALGACDLAIDAGTAWAGWLVGTAAVVLAGWLLAGPGAAIVAALAAVAGPALAWGLLRHRADARAEAELPVAMDAVARGLRSGGSLRQALSEASRAMTAGGALARDLADVARAIDHGATVVAALEAWGARRPLPGVRLAVAALCLGAEAGGAGARAVDGVATTLRHRLAALADARALATQARASAVVIAVAPVAFCGLASATDNRTAEFLLGSPVGLAMLVAGLTLDALGALWMAKLTQVPV